MEAWLSARGKRCAELITFLYILCVWPLVKKKSTCHEEVGHEDISAGETAANA